jgi:hypothetical protein
VQELGHLTTAARAAGRPLATFGMDAELKFASARDRAAFAAELGEALEGLVAKYHDESAPGGRAHRLIVALHPSITNHRRRSDRDAP